MTAFATRTHVPARTSTRFSDVFGSARRTLANEFLAGRAARAQRVIAGDLHLQLLDRA